METITKKKPKKTKKPTKTYNFNIREKIEAGLVWAYLVKLDNDVALEIVKEAENNPNGSDYIKIINNRLRSAYKIKTKK